MTVTLSPEEVEELVKDYLRSKFDTIGDVNLEVGRELVGGQMDEHYVTVFKGATTEVEL